MYVVYNYVPTLFYKSAYTGAQNYIFVNNVNNTINSWSRKGQQCFCEQIKQVIELLEVKSHVAAFVSQHCAISTPQYSVQCNDRLQKTIDKLTFASLDCREYLPSPPTKHTSAVKRATQFKLSPPRLRCCTVLSAAFQAAKWWTASSVGVSKYTQHYRKTNLQFLLPCVLWCYWLLYFYFLLKFNFLYLTHMLLLFIFSLV